jgi:hypothetical protein
MVNRAMQQVDVLAEHANEDETIPEVPYEGN